MPMDFKTSPQMHQISKKKYCTPKECKAPRDVGEALRNAFDFNGTLAFQGIQILFSTCRILLSIAHQYLNVKHDNTNNDLLILNFLTLRLMCQLRQAQGLNYNSSEDVPSFLVDLVSAFACILLMALKRKVYGVH